MVDSLAALAFDEAALRLPAVVDSLAALAFNKAWRRASLGAEKGLPPRDPRESRGWIDDPLSVALRGMRERWDEQSGTLSARAPRRSVQVAGAATA